MFDTEVELFKQTGQWLPLARQIAEARDQGKIFREGELIPCFSDIKRMANAYRFLEAKRPEVLKEPIAKGTFRQISYLPHIFSLLPEEGRDALIEEYLDKILKGEMAVNRLTDISVELKGGRNEVKKEIPVSSPPIDITQEDMEYVGVSINFIEQTLKLMVTKYGYEALYQKHASKCDALATLLRCIADPEYKKMWEERREGTVTL